MIEEAYCSFEVAKLLKEKGFELDTSKDYWKIGEDGTMYFMSSIGAYTSNPNDEYAFYRPENSYPCPTHQTAMAWLREHGFHINAAISYDYSVDADGNEVDRWTFWLFEILSSFSGNLIYTEEVNEYNTYEEAVEVALKYCLENLI